MSKVTFDSSADKIPENDEEAPQRDLSIQEEYQLWRKNCPFMYDFVSETALTWPSLTIQWLPDEIKSDTNSGIPQRLILGTHTSDEDVDYLKIASTQLPQSLLSTKKSELKQVQKNDEDASKDKQEQTINARLRVTKKFKHEKEINRARYNPLNPSIVSTISGSGDVFLYNISEAKTSPVLLKHHSENGYGLSWNSIVNNQLLTSSDDKTIAFWDTSSTQSPKSVFNEHTDIVNDVQWHNKDANVFGSVSDDKTIRIFDSRTSSANQVVNRFSAINSIAFSKHSANLFAVGLEDSNIELFDLRNTKSKLHTIMGHSDSISALEWDPHNDGILASGSQDRRVILWDIKKIGEEQVQEDEDDGAPELFVMHAGHTSPITDLSFNPSIPWTLATAADDNIVHLWRISKKLSDDYYGVDDDIDIYSLE